MCQFLEHGLAIFFPYYSVLGDTQPKGKVLRFWFTAAVETAPAVQPVERPPVLSSVADQRKR